jgi:hypothetical protein
MRASRSFRRADKRSCSSVLGEGDEDRRARPALGREDESGVGAPGDEVGGGLDKESEANCSERAMPDPEAAQNFMYRLTIRLK